MAFWSLLIILSFVLPKVYAQNDWNVPCFNGTCQWSIPSTEAGASGTVKIWGAVDAISDITTAAGWEIIGCSPNALSQDVRLVCKSADTNSAGCDHLYQNVGAEGKIVRLPNNCGKSPFARVARAWVPKDQSIPSHIVKRLEQRDVPAQVKALTLDTDFHRIDNSRVGQVNLAIVGANIPGVDPTIVQHASTRQFNGRIAERGFTDFIKKGIDSIKKLDKFSVNKSKALPPIDVNKNFNLFKKEISCPPVTAGISVDANAKAHAVVSVGVVASGTIVPPKVSGFSVVAGLNADLTGSIDLNADVTGTLDSGKIKIFEVGIPGLDFPGVLSIGPSFVVNAQTKASLDLNVDLNVGLNYHIANAQLVFPPSSKSTGSFQIGDTPLTLSASPSVKATGSVEAHIIPTLNLGINALNGVAGANVFIDLDTSAKMALSLEAGAKASVSVQKAKRAPAAAIPTNVAAPVPPDFYKNKVETVASAKTSSKAKVTTATKAPTSAKATTTKVASGGKGLATTTSTSTTFGGCFDITAGLAVNAGADASFFGLFNTGKQVSLFTKNFELFKKCFGDKATRRSISEWVKRSQLERLSVFEKRTFACPNAGITKAVSVADTNLSAASIKAV